LLPTSSGMDSSDYCISVCVRECVVTGLSELEVFYACNYYISRNPLCGASYNSNYKYIKNKSWLSIFVCCLFIYVSYVWSKLGRSRRCDVHLLLVRMTCNTCFLLSLSHNVLCHRLTLFSAFIFIAKNAIMYTRRF